MFFDGGGVTFTGGECTLQSEELSVLFAMLKKENISICIETNGSSSKLRELSENINYLIIDLKHFDDGLHKKWVGASNRSVKENIEYFFESGRQLHIRIPVINGVNAEPEGFADYFSRFNTRNAVFEFLAYHEFGKDKWQTEYQIKNGFVSPEMIAEFTRIFEESGMKTVST